MDNQDQYSSIEWDTKLDDINSIIGFDEIESVTGDTPNFDLTRLLENNNVGVDMPAPPCAVVVQSASSDTTFTQVQEQPFSPGMFLMQSVSSGTSIESTLLPYTTQKLSPDPMYFQPAKPDLHYVVSCPSHHSSTEPPPVEPVLLPYEMQIREEAAPVQSKQQQVTQINQDIAQNIQEIAQMRQEITQIKQELAPKVPNISDNSVAYVLSLGDAAAEAPKKRGWKRKYPEGTAKKTKTKLYEMPPMTDEKEEKRRKNSITAKQHRDKQKSERVSLLQQVKRLTAENDSLKKQLEEERTTAKLQQKLGYMECQGFIQM